MELGKGASLRAELLLEGIPSVYKVRVGEEAEPESCRGDGVPNLVAGFRAVEEEEGKSKEPCAFGEGSPVEAEGKAHRAMFGGEARSGENGGERGGAKLEQGIRH